MSYNNPNFHTIDFAVFDVAINLPKTSSKINLNILKNINNIEKSNNFSIVKIVEMLDQLDQKFYNYEFAKSRGCGPRLPRISRFCGGSPRK